jgi:hypothetical protein
VALRIVYARTVDYRDASARTVAAIARASSLATRATAGVIRQRQQQDIAASGKFGARWIEGLGVQATPSGGYSITNQIIVTHSEPGAVGFEYSATIHGNPLLWIPLSFADPNARAKGYPGGLFRVDRKSGKPLLLSLRDRKPKFVGVASITIPKKWHLATIATDALRNDFPKFYNQNLDL